MKRPTKKLADAQCLADLALQLLELTKGEWYRDEVVRVRREIKAIAEQIKGGRRA